MTSIDEAEKLARCPFCGGEAEAENYVIEAAVRCTGCGARVVRQHGMVDDTGYPAATAAWNRRSAIASRQAVVGQHDDLPEYDATSPRSVAEHIYAQCEQTVLSLNGLPERSRDALLSMLGHFKRLELSALAAPVGDETEEETEFGLLEDRLPIAGGKARVVERLSASMAGPVPEGWPSDELVDAAAEIISPNCCWPDAPNAHQQRRQDNARAKARAVLALASPAPALPEAPAGTLTEKMPTTPQHRVTPHIYAKPVASPAEGEAVESMAREICLFQGEKPWQVDRAGMEFWERYKPLAAAVLRHASSLRSPDREAVTREAVIEEVALNSRDIDILRSFEKSLTAWASDERTPDVLRADLRRFVSWLPPIFRALAQQAKPQQEKI